MNWPDLAKRLARIGALLAAVTAPSVFGATSGDGALALQNDQPPITKLKQKPLSEKDMQGPRLPRPPI